MSKDEIKKENEIIRKGLEKSYEELVKFKQAKNSPLVVSKAGKVVEIPPSDLAPKATYYK